MAHAWKACWVQALGGSNPPFSAKTRKSPETQRFPGIFLCSTCHRLGTSLGTPTEVRRREIISNGSHSSSLAVGVLNTKHPLAIATTTSTLPGGRHDDQHRPQARSPRTTVPARASATSRLNSRARPPPSPCPWDATTRCHRIPRWSRKPPPHTEPGSPARRRTPDTWTG